MILAATNPDTAAFSWAYVASAVGFVIALATFCATSVWLLDRLATRHIRRHVNRALNNGDQRALHAVTERESSR